MLEMNPEIREQWCKALRSGEYKQAKGVLWRKTDHSPSPDYPAGHCCLGVLTDLYVKATGKTTYPFNGQELDIWDEATLPDVVREWAGLESHNPTMYMAGGACAMAAEWNDERGATFDMIADMIDGGQAKG